MNPKIIQVYEKAKSYKVHIFWGLVVIALIAFHFLRGSDDAGKEFIEEEIRKRDSIAKIKEVQFDSVVDLANYLENQADYMRDENDQLRRRNRNLIHQVNEKAKTLRVIDSDFMRNARRISNSSSRFYKPNDSIR